MCRKRQVRLINTMLIFPKMDAINCILPTKTFKELQDENPGAEIISYLIPCLLIYDNNFNILVECVKGNVVVDIEKNKVAKIPTLQDVNLRELNILEIGMKLGEFTAEDTAKYVDHSPIIAQELIESLCKKEMLEFENGMYKVAPRFKFLYYPKIFATKERPVKIKVIENTNLKLIPSKFHVGSIIEKYGKILAINAIDECFILCHKVANQQLQS